MKEQEIDGLIVYSPYNLRYLANFTGTTGFALITLTDAYFVTDARYTQQAQQQAILASGNTSFAAQVQAVNNTGGTPAAEAAVATSGAVVATPSYSLSASTYPVGQCTWGAKTLAPWAGDYWGNGGQWAASAAAAGFRTGSQPQVGAIACWNDGGYGHVAVVTAVQSANNIQVSEANYAGNQSLGNHRGWFDPTNAQGYVTYIYPN